VSPKTGTEGSSGSLRLCLASLCLLCKLNTMLRLASVLCCCRMGAGEYALTDEVWAEVHDSAKDMISKMMVVDPAQRWPARDLLSHKWFQVRVRATHT